MISIRSGKVRSFVDHILDNRNVSKEIVSKEIVSKEVDSSRNVSNQNQVAFLPLLKSSFKTYCGQTSLHGYSYLFRDEENRFHFLHQIIWILVIVVSFYIKFLNIIL